MSNQPAPTSCPSCGLPDPKQVSAFPGSITVPSHRGDSTVTVYKCQCGYLFAVANVGPKPSNKPNKSEPGE